MKNPEKNECCEKCRIDTIDGVTLNPSVCLYPENWCPCHTPKSEPKRCCRNCRIFIGSSSDCSCPCHTPKPEEKVLELNECATCGLLDTTHPTKYCDKFTPEKPKEPYERGGHAIKVGGVCTFSKCDMHPKEKPKECVCGKPIPENYCQMGSTGIKYCSPKCCIDSVPYVAPEKEKECVTCDVSGDNPFHEHTTTPPVNTDWEEEFDWLWKTTDHTEIRLRVINFIATKKKEWEAQKEQAVKAEMRERIEKLETHWDAGDERHEWARRAYYRAAEDIKALLSDK